MKYYYRQKIIQIPVWDAPLYLIDTNDNEALKKKHNIDLDTMPHAQSWSVYKTKDGGKIKHYILILNTKEKFFLNSYGALCHESAHITGYILSDKGVKATFKNDEAFCYLQQYIFNQGAKFFFNFTN